MQENSSQPSFESLIQDAKTSLDKLNSNTLTLKESLQIYHQGLNSLQEAQKLLEEAQLQCELLTQQHTQN